MSTLLKPTISDAFWFEDGNIVLIAANVAFKVHRGQLSRHSEVFEDMFQLPQPPAGADLMYDGTPFVNLHDSAQDFAYFLGALYDGLYFVETSASDFACISAVLRLSTKYLFEHLRVQCMARLTQDWPTTLAGWDRREQQATDENERYLPRERICHPIHIISLSIELGLTEFLPSAFYDLCRYGPSKIVAGCPSLYDTSSVVTLSTDLLRRILRGRETGQQFTARFILEEIQGSTPSNDCSNPDLCARAFYYITLNSLRAVSGITYGREADPLFTLTQAMCMPERNDFSDGLKQCELRMCGTCKAEFIDICTKARVQVWDLLGTWFGSGGCL
ncbi:uncharacterized protein BT62DRAFT_1079649 [Guyanagaster necrorhizus]|uniref:BTB domain-containing protein n=1 Tax=Guyanagaster necrorhizus TaxID=856835 RepID=A0A9P7VK14_9AGAR|nr:uncharacterized protein BT62DRAFT_1079649 [Guyanagaster necrorhizus MCA 3950]KAG7442134.1 hypothetical protein BT62DRAFT_1079649 [Guyanagaster necrorhizus MCA 3950]